MSQNDAFQVHRGQGQAHTFLGLANRILVDGQSSGGRYSMVEFTAEPGAGAPPHSNSDDALAWYILEGTLTFETDEGTVELSEGDFCFHPPGFKHSFTNRGHERARVLIVVSPPGFEGFFVEAAKELPDAVPDGPPPAAAVEALREMGARYGMELHV